MIPAIDVHSHYFYLLDLKLIIFWYSPGSGEWINFFVMGFSIRKKPGYFFHTANAHMSTVLNSAHHRKSIDKALMEAIKCITEVSESNNILTVQGSLCIDPIRAFCFQGNATSGNKKLHLIRMVEKQRGILGG